MQLGLITDSVGNLPLGKALDLAAKLKLKLDTIEIATGNWSESPHANLADLISSATARKRLSEAVSSRGLTLSLLNANGNQLHPVSGPRHDQVVRDTLPPPRPGTGPGTMSPSAVGSREGVTRSAVLLRSVILRDSPDWAPARI